MVLDFCAFWASITFTIQVKVDMSVMCIVINIYVDILIYIKISKDAHGFGFLCVLGQYNFFQLSQSFSLQH